MKRFKFNTKKKLKGKPSQDGFCIPEGGIGAGPGGGIGPDKVEVLIHTGWFDKDNGNVTGLTVADSETVVIDGQEFVDLWNPPLSSYEEFESAVYQVVAVKLGVTGVVEE